MNSITGLNNCMIPMYILQSHISETYISIHHSPKNFVRAASHDDQTYYDGYR